MISEILLGVIAFELFILVILKFIRHKKYVPHYGRGRRFKKNFNKNENKS